MNILSEYAHTEFVKFIQNTHLQNQLNDLIAFHGLSDIDEIVKICLDMFLLQVEISKLQPHDLELLKLELYSVRSVPVDNRKMTSELCEQLYGNIKMLDTWSDVDFDARIREGREAKRMAAK